MLGQAWRQVFGERGLKAVGESTWRVAEDEAEALLAALEVAIASERTSSQRLAIPRSVTLRCASAMP